MHLLKRKHEGRGKRSEARWRKSISVCFVRSGPQPGFFVRSGARSVWFVRSRSWLVCFVRSGPRAGYYYGQNRPVCLLHSAHWRFTPKKRGEKRDLEKQTKSVLKHPTRKIPPSVLILWRTKILIIFMRQNQVAVSRTITLPLPSLLQVHFTPHGWFRLTNKRRNASQPSLNPTHVEKRTWEGEHSSPNRLKLNQNATTESLEVLKNM